MNEKEVDKAQLVEDLHAQLERVIDGYRDFNILNVTVIGVLELIKRTLLNDIKKHEKDE